MDGQAVGLSSFYLRDPGGQKTCGGFPKRFCTPRWNVGAPRPEVRFAGEACLAPTDVGPAGLS